MSSLEATLRCDGCGDVIDIMVTDALVVCDEECFDRRADDVREELEERWKIEDEYNQRTIDKMKLEKKWKEWYGACFQEGV